MNRTVSDKRLLKLAEFLDTLPPARFDYAVLVGSGWKGAPDLSCGTTACALGWAAAMPEFRRLGLMVTKNEWGSSWPTVRLKSNRKLSEYEAAAVVFGITKDEAWFLFEPNAHGYRLYPQPTFKAPGFHARPPTVAKHIKRFITWRAKVAA